MSGLLAARYGCVPILPLSRMCACGRNGSPWAQSAAQRRPPGRPCHPSCGILRPGMCPSLASRTVQRRATRCQWRMAWGRRRRHPPLPRVGRLPALPPGADQQHTDMVAAVFRPIFVQPHAEAVSDTWDEVRDRLTRAFTKIGHADGRGLDRDPGLHCVPAGALAENLVHESAGAGEPGDQALRPCGRDLPQPRFGDPARGSGPGRHARRVAIRRAPLSVRRVHGPTQTNLRYWRYHRDRQRRVGTEDHLKVHHPARHCCGLCSGRG